MALYEIVVRGHIDPKRRQWFDGMALVALPSGTTQLTGDLADQSALYGILSRIRDLGLELVSVQQHQAVHKAHPEDEDLQPQH